MSGPHRCRSRAHSAAPRGGLRKSSRRRIGSRAPPASPGKSLALASQPSNSQPAAIAGRDGIDDWARSDVSLGPLDRDEAQVALLHFFLQLTRIVPNAV